MTSGSLAQMQCGMQKLPAMHLHVGFGETDSYSTSLQHNSNPPYNRAALTEDMSSQHLLGHRPLTLAMSLPKEGGFVNSASDLLTQVFKETNIQHYVLYSLLISENRVFMCLHSLTAILLCCPQPETFLVFTWHTLYEKLLVLQPCNFYQVFPNTCESNHATKLFLDQLLF